MSEEKKQEQDRPSTIVIHDGQEHLPDVPKVGKPVDVNSDITPITRQPIQQVDATQWSELNISQLQEQLTVLERRLNIASTTGHEEIRKQLTLGVQRLRLLIKQKDNTTGLI